ncbi:MAG: LptE family protein [Bacteroides sp.]|nr:LptE family protein [Bacteroides sp.]
MDWIKKLTLIALVVACGLAVYSCKIQIGLAPITSIDYNKVKTISITDFENHATYVYGPLAVEFNQTLRDMFIQQTRLKVVDTGGDLELSGEITGYAQTNEAVDASGYSSKVRLTLTVKVTYVNNTNHEEDFTDQQFSAYQTYDATESLTSVQDGLITIMVDDITEQIFNSTVANW